MAYREGPPAAGLPLPRRFLTGFTAIARVAAGSAFVSLVFFVFTARGRTAWKNGGSGMYVLLLLSLVEVGALLALSASTVRGKRLPATILAAVPAVPVVAVAVLMRQVIQATFGELLGDPVHPALAARIAAEGMSAIDSLLVYGCYLGASGFGAAALALLGGAGSVDRRRDVAPSGRGFILTLVLGAFAVVVALGARLALHLTSPMMLVAIPWIAIVTAVATVAANNGRFIRAWHDGPEANQWLASFLGAALAATAAIVLLDLAACFAAEGIAMDAILDPRVELGQESRILSDQIPKIRAAATCAWIDGGLVFATIAAGLASGLGRGTDGRMRLPLGAPSLVALLAVILAGCVLFVARARTVAGFDVQVARRNAVLENVARAGIELPRFAQPERAIGAVADLESARLIVKADGSFEHFGKWSFKGTISLIADRRASWGAVAKAISSMLANQEQKSVWGLGGSMPAAEREGRGLPALYILVTLPPGESSLALGNYGVFIGPPYSMNKVFLVDEKTCDICLRPSPADDMDAVMSAVAARGAGFINVLPPGPTW